MLKFLRGSIFALAFLLTRVREAHHPSLCLLYAGLRLRDQEDLYTHNFNHPAESDAKTV